MAFPPSSSTELVAGSGLNDRSCGRGNCCITQSDCLSLIPPTEEGDDEMFSSCLAEIVGDLK